MCNKELEHTILIGESESELLVLFREYLTSIGIKTITANSGHEIIDYFLDSVKNNYAYNVIVIDTHLSDTPGLDIAKRIRLEKPDQRLVLVTTTPKENLRQECLDTAGLSDNNILTMPFKMSKFSSVLKNQ